MGVLIKLLCYQSLQLTAMRMINHLPDKLVESDLFGLSAKVPDLLASHLLVLAE